MITTTPSAGSVFRRYRLAGNETRQRIGAVNLLGIRSGFGRPLIRRPPRRGKQRVSRVPRARGQ